MPSLPTYIVITPARNEAALIENTIRSVVAQSVLPLRWVIVSDGSTDATDEIVQRYATDYPWIQLVRTPERKERHFAGKVLAFRAGYETVQGLNYDVIASLDADITFESDYFDFLLKKLADDPSLGVVGTPFDDAGKVYDYRFVSIEHVSGACQVFRRQCFEAIGGYIPVKGGSIDHIAVISARMKGWQTRTFTEKKSFHHRVMGTAEANELRAKYNYGVKDYVIGNHPVWECVRTLRQMRERPYVLSGAALAMGYCSAAIRRLPRPVSAEFLRFHRNEQMARLKRFLFAGKSSSSSKDASASSSESNSTAKVAASSNL